jgi:3-phenylpropionate/trans-cinnamate dioxygenase ferredoxin component
MTATSDVAAEWVDVCPTDDLPVDDLIRFDHGDRTFAVYRTSDSRYFATDGACTHGKVHLSKGYLSSTVIECAKHNGRFDITTGRALGAPALIDLGCHRVRVTDGIVQLRVGLA